MALVELISLLTHLGVFIRGLGGIMKVMPLPRGRRSGLDLILMALAMTILAVGPRRWFGELVALSYAVTFVVALWLLIGPVGSGGGTER